MEFMKPKRVMRRETYRLFKAIYGIPIWKDIDLRVERKRPYNFKPCKPKKGTQD